MPTSIDSLVASRDRYLGNRERTGDKNLTDLELVRLLKAASSGSYKKETGAFSASKISAGENDFFRQLQSTFANDLDEGATARLAAFISKLPAIDNRGGGTVIQVIGTPEHPGDDKSGTIRGDVILLPGTATADSRITPVTTGWLSTKACPLKQTDLQLGSTPIPNSVTNASTVEADRKSYRAGKALDAMAAAAKVEFDDFFDTHDEQWSTFDDIFTKSKQFCDPSVERWWGKCHAWSSMTLSQKLNRLLSPDGNGIWFKGEWISKANLNNVTMALTDSLSQRVKGGFIKHPNAMNMLRGGGHFVFSNGGAIGSSPVPGRKPFGVVIDVHNDENEGAEEVWNQGLVAGSVTNSIVTDDALKAAVLAKTQATGTVMVSKIDVTYSLESDDGNEGPGGTENATYYVYSVVDDNGKVVKGGGEDAAVYGYDLAKENKTLRQIEKGSFAPDWFWIPDLKSIEDILDGKAPSGTDAREIKADPLYDRFVFFSRVLREGTSAQKRADFESAYKRARDASGNITPAEARRLSDMLDEVKSGYSDADLQMFGEQGIR